MRNPFSVEIDVRTFMASGRALWGRLKNPQKFFREPRVWIIVTIGVAIVLATAVIPLSQLDMPYWGDEIMSINFVQSNLHYLFREIYIDCVNPILYYLLLWVWVKGFGIAPSATAMLSLFSAMLTGCLVYRFGRILFDRLTGLVAAVLCWESFFSLHYATETRMYILLAAVGAWSSAGLYRWLEKHSRASLWWYWAASCLGVYLHYGYWFFLYAQNIIVVIRWLCRRLLPPDARRWVWGQVLLFIVYLPWLPVIWRWLFDFYIHGHRDWISAMYPAGGWWFSLEVFQWFLFPYWGYPSWVGQAILVFIAALLLSYFLDITRSEKRLRVRVVAPPWVAGYLCVLAFFPVAILTLLNVGVVRYAAMAAPAFFLLIAAALVRLVRAFRISLLIPGILLAALAALNLGHAIRYWDMSGGPPPKVSQEIVNEYWKTQRSGE